MTEYRHDLPIGYPPSSKPSAGAHKIGAREMTHSQP
jgi:hypothetical protein